MTMMMLFCFATLLVLACVHAKEEEGKFLVGTGIHDITGPAAQVHLQGYGKSSQVSNGILMRSRARAFIVADASGLDDGLLGGTLDVQAPGLRRHHDRENARDTLSASAFADPEQTVCFVSADIGSGSDLLTLKVVQRLEELLPKQKGSEKRLCHRENLSISATHAHSATGGFLQYVLYQIPSLGYSKETMDAYVEGISQAVYSAYTSLATGEITLSEGLLFDSNINRSPSSYLLNPEEERKKYEKEGDTDKKMLQLRFTTQPSGDSEDIGILNWFSVHGTCLNYTNGLISGDNRGYASYLMEKYKNGNDTLPGLGSFVAAFASTNLGDVSPNTAGPKCIDTGLPCDFETSTCGGLNENCIASGPGKDMYESAEIIGRKQFDMALSLLNSNETKTLAGKVSYRHSFVDLGNLTVELNNGTKARTCPAALGYGFAGGTTDGPGGFDFTQGSNSSNPFWDMIAGFVSKPTKEQVQCQHPKPILLNTGEATEPYDWDPNSVPMSVFRMGSLFILNVPSELTTMAGRRLREAVADVLTSKGVKDPVVTIAGLANSYTHYVTTIEEYAGQRYEAASTLYGPHTLSAYIQEFKRITTDLMIGTPSATSDPPEDLTCKQISLIPPVLVDTVAFGKKFGSVVDAPREEYTRGQDSVFVSFRSANPRNNRRPQGTFLTVDKKLDDGSWKTMFVDGDWCTRFVWVWKGAEALLGRSFAEIHWQIPSEAPTGHYRICHFGARKKLLSEGEMLDRSLVGTSSRIVEFSGCTNSFLVRDGGSPIEG